ncbi:MAG: SsrA-binding protein SmpB [Patescibacteria group bacterium]
MKKRKKSSLINSRARYDYDLDEPITAGLVLTGAEVKSIRNGRATIAGAFVTYKDGEFWLNNLSLAPMPTNAAHLKESDLSRPRKLLLKKRQVDMLSQLKDSGKTIVALEIIVGRYIKVRIASARGKKKYDKRADLKKKTQKREADKRLSRR